MQETAANVEQPSFMHKSTPLRRAIWRGSAIIAPPLVTLLLIIWIGTAIEQYVLKPLELGGRTVLVWATQDILSAPPAGATLIDPSNPSVGFLHQGVTYVNPPLGERYLPKYIIERVNADIDSLPADLPPPQTATAYYHAYVKMRYMPRWFTVPLLLIVLLSVLFFVGRFFAAGIGRMTVNLAERVINRLPIVRNLYSSVKQVTDFVLSDREIEFTRVVVIEYPRLGVYCMGFVTSDGIPQLAAALGEEMITVFVPTSPMPMTGFTTNMRKRDAIDIDLSIDQAVQFIVSCGVVVPEPTILSSFTQPALLSTTRAGLN